MELSKSKIAVIGLGYVGLPLMVEFAKKYQTLGFDINSRRIDQLNKNQDTTLELSPEEMADAKYGIFSADPKSLQNCNVFIVTVPTPIDDQKKPHLTPLIKASETVGAYLNEGDVVIYESTVYPGATEEICVPILEQQSNLKFNSSFYVGYSPERINPGDKIHRLTAITKVTSGSTPETADFVDCLYSSIIPAGTHRASSIMVAEAAKVIENTQRDLNIALINELSVIFNKLNIDTEEVLEAAGTKWNFLPFRPGLVGGHCISVDPYYLTHKAKELGYQPNVILAGRKINDSMGGYIVERLIMKMAQNKISVVGSKILIMGLSFKENCPDLRNTRVIDIISGLTESHAKVDVYDPWVDTAAAREEYDLSLINEPLTAEYDAVILAVAHDVFKETGIKSIRKFMKSNNVIFDIKYIFPIDENLFRL